MAIEQEEIGREDHVQRRFHDGMFHMDVTYVYDGRIPKWSMLFPDGCSMQLEDVLLFEAAIHELRRLNGTLPPVRVGGTRPAKGGEWMRKRDELTRPDSCMSRAKDDEWTFVLLGRDRAAPVAVRAWIAERLHLGKNRPDDPQIVEARQWADTVEQEQEGG